MSHGSVVSVASRCEDIGLARIAQDLRNATTRARRRELFLEAKQGALVTQQAAHHFALKLVGSLAQDLYLEAIGALKLLDDEEQAECVPDPVRPPGAFTYEQWQAAGCRPPPNVARCDTGKRAA